MRPTFPLIIASVFALSACMGGGDDSEFATLTQQADDIFDQLEGEELDRVIAPTSGTASYEGVALYAEEDSNEDAAYAAIGSFVATADFDANPIVTGRMSDFFEISNVEELDELGENADLSDAETSGEISGSFDVVLGQRDRIRGLTGTISGSLTKDSGQTVSYVGDDAIDAEAFFAGDNNVAEYISVYGQTELQGGGGAFVSAIGADPATTAVGGTLP